MGDNAKTLDNEIVRVCKSYFNYVEPSIFATVTRVHSNTADINLPAGKEPIPVRNVPVLRPCYGSGSLNLSIGDKVLLIFQAGNIAAPVIVGKI